VRNVEDNTAGREDTVEKYCIRLHTKPISFPVRMGNVILDENRKI
jgi:hypothetical protein